MEGELRHLEKNPEKNHALRVRSSRRPQTTADAKRPETAGTGLFPRFRQA
jgi:hypothetical protein